MAGVLDSVTHKATILVVSTLAGVAAFGWVLASYQLTPEDQSKIAKADPVLRERMDDLRQGVSEYQAKGDFAGAARLQEKLVALDPASVGDWQKLADLLAATGREQEANAALEEAAEIQFGRARRQGNSAVEWEAAAKRLSRVGRSEDARGAWEEAGKLYLGEAERRDDERAWRLAALAQEKAGNEATARRAWRRTAEAEEELAGNPRLSPRDAEQALDKAYLAYDRIGDEEGARRVAERMIDDWQELAETSSEAVWTPYYVGWSHRRLGNEAEAQRIWRLGRENVERLVESGAIARRFGWYNAACVRALVGDVEAAIEALEIASRVPPPDVDTAYVRDDVDLVSLHDHPRFDEIAAQFDLWR